MQALRKVSMVKRSADESDLSDGQRRKSARSLDLGLQRRLDFASSRVECEGSEADEPIVQPQVLMSRTFCERNSCRRKHPILLRLLRKRFDWRGYGKDVLKC